MADITQLVGAQREFFLSNKTLDIKWRKEQLKLLKKNIQKHESEILQALHDDLNKSKTEAFMTEVGIVYHEIGFMIRNIDKLCRPQKVHTPLHEFPAKSIIYRQPHGVVLVMSPWNYPFNLSLVPLVGAIACGNTCVLKPSAYSAKTSEILAKIIGETFAPEYVTTVVGGREENKQLLEQQFDYIFFTGSPTVGKEVMSAAAKYLTPVTLELGGKSPVIIDKSADFNLSAKRLVWGKLINAGQTCVCPDYIFVPKGRAIEFIDKCIKWIKTYYKEDLASFGKIINEKHFKRLSNLISRSKVYYGGDIHPETNQIEPTVLYPVSFDEPVMGEEIFGPILPFVEYDDMNQVINYIRRQPRPLAMYLFAKDKKVIEDIMSSVPFGGGCVNDCIVHLSTDELPFGGIGNSGMGRYHGKASIDTFTVAKSVLNKSLKLDIEMRYPPYNDAKFNLIKKFLN